MVDVVLGYRSAAEYRSLNAKNSFGATIGRYAGRIGGARFPLDGKWVRLRPNDGPNALHGGGAVRLDTVEWHVLRCDPRERSITFGLISPDGFQGFPGRLRLRVTYALGEDNALSIEYRARTTRTTSLNLTNHSYFNLAGAGSGPVVGQMLAIAASRYVVTDGRGIPTGALAPVEGTALDFRVPHSIGERIDGRTGPMTGRGYNHSLVFDAPRDRRAPVVRLCDPASGRTLAIETTEPSVQIYSADYLNGRDRGADGQVLSPRAGMALETEHLPDSPNHPAFPTTTLRPAQTFRARTVWRFGTSRPGSCA